MKKQYLSLLFLAIIGAGAYAAAADTVLQLKDGRSVVLHDDFTWEYMQPRASDKTQSSKFDEKNKLKPIEAIPVVSNHQRHLAQIQLGSDKNILQLNQSGVELLFQAARYEQGALIIPVAVTNNGKSSVIKIDVVYQLFDSQGEQILKDEASVWTSVKRLPETYLRPKQQSQGVELRIPVGKLASYDFKAEIKDISTRN